MKRITSRITRINWRASIWGLAVVTSASLGYIGYELISYRHMHFGVFDLGLYNRHLWGMVHGGFGPNPLMGFNLLGDHAHFILILLAPFYALWQSPEFLLVVQALGLSLAGWPIYKAARYLGHTDLQASAWLIPFYSFFGFWSSLIFPFHVAALSVLPLSWALYFLITRQDRNLVIALIIAALTKEDTPLVAIMIGVYLIILRRQWRLGASLIVAGAVYIEAITKVWIPWVRHSPYPFDGIQLAWNELKTHTINIMMLSFGWLPLGALEVFILLAPLWVSRFLSNMPARWDTNQHYGANQGPILALAAMVATVRIAAWLTRRYPKLKQHQTRLLWGGIAIATAGTIMVWQAPEQKWIWPFNDFVRIHRNPTELTAQQAFAMIPPTASVGVQCDFPELTSRPEVYLVPFDLTKRQPDYLILSNSMFAWPFPNYDAVNAYIAQARDLGYETLIDHDGITLLRKK